jgi:hypothetical protein
VYRFGIWVVAVTFAALTLVTVVALLVWDLAPSAFPTRAHDVLGAAPLALIALSFLIYQAPRRLNRLEAVKTIALVAAFLFWAANQFLPNSPHATLFNDLAIALFVLDVVLSIVGWPPTLPHFGPADTAPLSHSPQQSATTNGTGYPASNGQHPATPTEQDSRS